MSKELRIEPLTRVEGHGNVIIRIKENKLEEVELNLIESPRFFEKLLVGKFAEEAPRISERVCGICYVDHHLASVKAVEAAWDISPPDIAIKLRKLLHSAALITSHTLHLSLLCLPDLLDIEERNLVGLAKANPDLVKTALRIHDFGNKVVTSIGGRTVHCVTAIPGGMAKQLTKDQKNILLPLASKSLEDVKAFAEIFFDLIQKKTNEFNFPKEDKYNVAITNNGLHEIYDGDVRVIDPKGNVLYDFDPSKYLDFIAERVKDHSFTKAPYLKQIGYPSGIYRVGPLARLNVVDKINGNYAPKYAEEFYKIFGKPAKDPMAYNMARMIELVSYIEETIDLLKDEKITGEKIRSPAKERKGEGVGIVEAPRGTLIHHYVTDEKGIITKANLIVPTTMNSPIIENDLREYAKQQISELIGLENGKALWKLESLVRTYDPCISCSCHFIRIDRNE
jgi:F420-non-reducing hydrogenase large subunit